MSMCEGKGYRKWCAEKRELTEEVSEMSTIPELHADIRDLPPSSGQYLDFHPPPLMMMPLASP